MYCSHSQCSGRSQRISDALHFHNLERILACMCFVLIASMIQPRSPYSALPSGAIKSPALRPNGPVLSPSVTVVKLLRDSYDEL